GGRHLVGAVVRRGHHPVPPGRAAVPEAQGPAAGQHLPPQGHHLTLTVMPARRASTLVIIPAKDEEAALPAVLASLAAEVPELDVAVIDDGSTDATALVAQAGGATVLSLPFNLGIGGALRTGFRYAVREGYERGVQFDADGQHDATQIA